MSLRVRLLDPFELPGPSDQLLKSGLVISAVESGVDSERPSIPFRIRHDTSWLKLEPAEGVLPAELNAIADPRGLSPGFYSERLSIEIAGTVQTAVVALTVGPLLQASGLSNSLQLPAGRPFTHRFTILSSSTPIDLKLESQSPWLKVSPESGRTPQEVQASITFH